MGNRIDPGHSQIRGVLRILGPTVAIAGLMLTAIGLISFFSSFGSFETPKYFWCAFIGLPLLGVGVAVTGYGFMGSVARYQAGEVAPVMKDTFNYMADGTKDGIQTVASAIGRGLSSEAGNVTATSTRIRCPKCNQDNDEEARFCDECGYSLQKTKACPACEEMNDPDAKFCDNCGQGLN